MPMTHEQIIESWKEEESLWKERERLLLSDLTRLQGELEAARKAWMVKDADGKPMRVFLIEENAYDYKCMASGSSVVEVSIIEPKTQS